MYDNPTLNVENVKWFVEKKSELIHLLKCFLKIERAERNLVSGRTGVSGVDINQHREIVALNRLIAVMGNAQQALILAACGKHHIPIGASSNTRQTTIASTSKNIAEIALMRNAAVSRLRILRTGDPAAKLKASASDFGVILARPVLVVSTPDGVVGDNSSMAAIDGTAIGDSFMNESSRPPSYNKKRKLVADQEGRLKFRSGYY